MNPDERTDLDQQSDAGAYEIQVIGYTDNQRPGKSAARFPTRS